MGSRSITVILVAVTQPHAAYVVLILGFSSKWNCYLWTYQIPDKQISVLEHAICHKFLSTIIPYSPNDLERELFSLHISLGVMEFVILIRLPENFMKVVSSSS